ncbi:hypothetical protein CYLTODRAFT_452984 [Cylindrobasidium torrendii FP15055 ss-10]|uniref:Uncharacterized protein n=1 Tax=Cylindrobasidium torrendii FP15055 ss-10 TaxID=1314674 RepID=A0A0D7BG36_9AGAR|nr:hypothetical protein CYLTODRAFT_452984 [Cylindrobasidium torrendii FP15055 ss-10]
MSEKEKSMYEQEKARDASIASSEAEDETPPATPVVCVSSPLTPVPASPISLSIASERETPSDDTSSSASDSSRSESSTPSRQAHPQNRQESLESYMRCSHWDPKRSNRTAKTAEDMDALLPARETEHFDPSSTLYYPETESDIGSSVSSPSPAYFNDIDPYDLTPLQLNRNPSPTMSSGHSVPATPEPGEGMDVDLIVEPSTDEEMFFLEETPESEIMPLLDLIAPRLSLSPIPESMSTDSVAADPDGSTPWWIGSLSVRLPAEDLKFEVGMVELRILEIHIQFDGQILPLDDELLVCMHSAAAFQELQRMTPPLVATGSLSIRAAMEHSHIGDTNALHFVEVLQNTKFFASAPLNTVSVAGLGRVQLRLVLANSTNNSSSLRAYIVFNMLPNPLPETLGTSYSRGILEDVQIKHPTMSIPLSAWTLFDLQIVSWPADWLHRNLKSKERRTDDAPLRTVVLLGSEPTPHVRLMASIVAHILSAYRECRVQVHQVEGGVEWDDADLVFINYELLKTPAALPSSFVKRRRDISFIGYGDPYEGEAFSRQEDTSILWQEGGIVTMTPETIGKKLVALDRILQKIGRDPNWKLVVLTHVFGRALCDHYPDGDTQTIKAHRSW